MKNSSIFGRKTLCLITGASRGIGESIAKNFAAKLASDSKLILLARNKENLELVRFDIISLNPTLSVDTVSCDLSQPNAKEYESILSNFQHSQFEVIDQI